MSSKIPIRYWADDEKPREKLLEKGADVLSTSELLAILLRAGNGEESAVDLARRMLTDCDNDLNKMARWGVRDYTNRYKGVGIAKAATIIAAFELARRRQLSGPDTSPILNSSREIYNYLRTKLEDLDHEEFWIILLNNACRLQGSERLFSGGFDGLSVDLRMLFGKALEMKARSLIVAHNHPSGNLYPSHKDVTLTRNIKEAAKTLGIALLDHIILGRGGYYSFADNGTL